MCSLFYFWYCFVHLQTFPPRIAPKHLFSVRLLSLSFLESGVQLFWVCVGLPTFCGAWTSHAFDSSCISGQLLCNHSYFSILIAFYSLFLTFCLSSIMPKISSVTNSFILVLVHFSYLSSISWDLSFLSFFSVLRMSSSVFRWFFI